ncbi:MAG: tRNA 2-thiouridine(34) synthase MnmA [Lachnospiraceae bacterium]|nr:tRNA 2-thiouridine(34) synthase MnmA [Lachnospiraceae bacterium]
MAKVIVGMSGGVDSAVCAYLLKMAGHEVIGVTLKTWVASDQKENRCCRIDDASAVASMLGVPYYAVNCMMDFDRCVIDPFIEDYMKGRTPNPCILCNPLVKWGKMEESMKVLGADYIATGHYATICKLPNNRYTVGQALHAQKDQTYMLYRLSQEQLAHTMMPLGKLTKEEVRDIAHKAGIPVASKPDSQEICFIPDNDYSGYIEENAKVPVPGEGDFVSEDGTFLGKHKGIIHYTIGQRRGLGLPLGYHAYVKRIDPVKNEVIIAKDEALYSAKILCDSLNFMGIPDPKIGERLRFDVKVRYHHKAQSAVVEKTKDDEVIIRFDEPVRAAAPGQSAVFYNEDLQVAGGGIIREVFYPEDEKQ